MIVNQITEPPFYLVGVFIHNLYVSPLDVLLSWRGSTLDRIVRR